MNRITQASIFHASQVQIIPVNGFKNKLFTCSKWKDFRDYPKKISSRNWPLIIQVPHWLNHFLYWYGSACICVIQSLSFLGTFLIKFLLFNACYRYSDKNFCNKNIFNIKVYIYISDLAFPGGRKGSFRYNHKSLSGICGPISIILAKSLKNSSRRVWEELPKGLELN